MPPTIRVHVNELTLHGLPHYDRGRMARAFEAELALRLREFDLPSGLSRPGRAERLVAPDSVVARPDARPESVGQQVGRAVWRSLGGAAR